MTDLKEALSIVKAAGYRVTMPKPRVAKTMRVGPTCVVKWGDGEVTRMSIHTNDNDPDFGRGIRVSTAAYEARRARRLRSPAFNRLAANPMMHARLRAWLQRPAPAIEEVHFERDGAVIASGAQDRRAAA